MPPTPTIEAVETLAQVSCPTCGILHAIPRALHLAAAREQLPLHCPAGHAWTPLPPDCGPSSDLVQSLIEISAALADSRHELQAATIRVAELEAALKGRSPLDRKEMKRRAQFLANRALSMGYGRKECPVCKCERRGTFLVEHLRREHSETLADYPADMFEPNAAIAAAVG